MAGMFGCCSSFTVCSGTLECLHPGEELYKGCGLLKLLKKKKEKLEQELQQAREEPPVIEKQDRKPKEVYIAGLKQFFKVLKRNKNNLSYELTYEEAVTVGTVFDDNGIPYKNGISAMDCEVGFGEPVPMDGAPCDSRVVVEINGEEYNILNFNCYLIKEWYAEKLNLAFRNKGFKSRVEITGKYVTPEAYKYKGPGKKEPAAEVQERKREVVKPVEYRQVMLFEYMSVSGY